MRRTVSIVLISGFILLSRSYAQEVMIGRETKPKSSKTEAAPAKQAKTAEKAVTAQSGKAKAEEKSAQVAKKDAAPGQKNAPATASEIPHKQEAVASSQSKGTKVRPETVAKAELKSDTPSKQTVAAKTAKVESAATKKAPSVSPAPELAKPDVAVSQPAKSDVPAEQKAGHSWLKTLVGPPQQPAKKSDVNVATSQEVSGTVLKPPPVVALPKRTMTEVSSNRSLAVPFNGPIYKEAMVAPLPQKTATEVGSARSLAVPLNEPPHMEAPVPAKSLAMQTRVAENTAAQPISNNFDTAFTKLADGFDFPVGRPDAQGYYKARGFRSHGHLGEDWDGVRGGDTDLGDPIYSIGDGVVVFARDCHLGWGNVVIVRHSYREGGVVKNVDALYGHLNSMVVARGQTVARGQRIATMGTAHGLYDAHLHLEIRKNIEIGMSRAAFARDFSNYYDPSQFIQAHRHLQTGGGTYRVAMNTFTRDSNIKWDKVRNYSHAHTGGGTRQSSAALKKAVAAKH